VGSHAVSDLFESSGLEASAPTPLAERLRPRSLDDVVGQEALLGEGGRLRKLLDGGCVPSMILWGPPGVGKTTIARLLAGAGGLEFEQISAIFSGVADLRKAFDRAKARRAAGKGTLLFVDEIHRFNKAQQDAFLPHVEDGAITLVGATTENPSFELNRALLSRTQVFVLKSLDDAAIETLLRRAEAAAGRRLPLTREARAALRSMAGGDGRFAITLAETVMAATEEGVDPIDAGALGVLVDRRAAAYDRAGDIHYDLASVLQKSIRGSDVDAALYWAARMLEGGEDPLFILRRLIVVASEDVGNADPRALPLAIAARDAFQMLGSPEGEIAIGQLVAFLATAPKSNASHAAFNEARSAARETGSLPPPMFARAKGTKSAKGVETDAAYRYDHDAPGGFAGQNYFPDAIPRRVFYQPTDRGYDRVIAERIADWRERRVAGTSS